MRSSGHREVVNTYFGPFSFMVILAGGRMRDVCLIESAVGFESLAEKVRLFLFGSQTNHRKVGQRASDVVTTQSREVKSPENRLSPGQDLSQRFRARLPELNADFAGDRNSKGLIL